MYLTVSNETAIRMNFTVFRNFDNFKRIAWVLLYEQGKPRRKYERIYSIFTDTRKY